MNTLNVKIKTQLPAQMAKDLRLHMINVCGFSQITYWRYLQGKSQDQRIGLAIAAYLGISFEDLLNPAKVLVPKPPDQHVA